MKRALLLAAVAACAGSERHPPAPAPPAPAAARDPVEVGMEAIRQEDLVADVAWLTSPELKGRGSFSAEAKTTAARIEERFRALGLQVSRQEIPHTGGQENVIGVLPGGDETVIVCAHYDHLGVLNGETYWGADDNASGVAVLLAVARAATAGSDGHHRRTVVFLATGAEEAGLLGAQAYVDSPLRPLASTKAVLNFDMVGRRFVEAGPNLDDAVAVTGLEADPTFGDAVRSAAASEKVYLVPVTDTLLTLFGFDHRTDDWVFRSASVPSADFSTGMHADYHKPTDTPDRISAAQLLRVARIAARAMFALW